MLVDNKYDFYHMFNHNTLSRNISNKDGNRLQASGASESFTELVTKKLSLVSL